MWSPRQHDAAAAIRRVPQAAVQSPCTLLLDDACGRLSRTRGVACSLCAPGLAGIRWGRGHSLFTPRSTAVSWQADLRRPLGQKPGVACSLHARFGRYQVDSMTGRVSDQEPLTAGRLTCADSSASSRSLASARSSPSLDRSAVPSAASLRMDSILPWHFRSELASLKRGRSMSLHVYTPMRHRTAALLVVPGVPGYSAVPQHHHQPSCAASKPPCTLPGHLVCVLSCNV